MKASVEETLASMSAEFAAQMHLMQLKVAALEKSVSEALALINRTDKTVVKLKNFDAIQREVSNEREREKRERIKDAREARK